MVIDMEWHAVKIQLRHQIRAERNPATALRLCKYLEAMDKLDRVRVSEKKDDKRN